MSKPLHLNLIKEEELFSSCPIRNQVIAPITAGVITLITLIWWLLLYVNFASLENLNSRHSGINKELQPAYRSVLALNSREKDLTALTGQLKAFQNAKLHYGSFLKNIPGHIRTNVQFTKLEVLPPPPPLFEKDKKSGGPTNTFEKAGMHITGLTTGNNAFDSVNSLLKALQSDIYTNLIKHALIPKGSFRQDTRSARDGHVLRFEIRCECRNREFKP
ncbi:MAG: hypothetical protein R6V06_08480 [Kiritimatiellia bacterium]